MIQFLVKNGPMQPVVQDLPQKQFPRNKYNRSFQTAWFWKQLPGNRYVLRDWLSYSISNNNLYCHHCILFGKNQQKAWTKNGFSVWVRALHSIVQHECSESHVEALLKFKLYQTSLPIIPLLVEKQQQEKAMNREVVRSLIDITFFLAKNCIAFRGHRENSFYTGNRGNFLNLTKIIAKYSPPLATYIAKLETMKKPEVNFTSKLRQNQLIHSISTTIKSFIMKEIKEAKFFSVSMDSTFDLSRKEQISFIIRYVAEDGNINERLVALKDSPSTTGLSMFNIFETICNELSLDWLNYLVGQSFDGAQNMKGEYKGLQSRINDKCPTATFIWCCAHRLNLIVTKAVGCSSDAVDLFGNLEALYNFISGSKKRVAYYEAAQKKYSTTKQGRRLKRVSTTRWMSHDYALESVLNTFESVIETLEYSRQIEDCNDHTANHMAGCLMDYLLSKRFLMSGFWFKKLFNILAPLNSILQTKDLDLLAAVRVICEAQKTLQNARNKESDILFESLINEVNNYTKDNKTFEFEDIKTKRSRRKKKLSGQKACDEPILDPIQLFKVDTFLVSLDVTLNSIKQYFNDDVIGIYKDLSLFSKRRIIEIKNNRNSMPEDSFEKLCAVYHKFLDRDLLTKEYLHFCLIYDKFENTKLLPTNLHAAASFSSTSEMEDEYEVDENLDEIFDFHKRRVLNPYNMDSMKTVFKTFQDSRLSGIFPTLNTSLLIALTLPVTSASTERSFSKLKLVKTILRTTMSQERLEDLIMISCERDIEVQHEDILILHSKVLY